MRINEESVVMATSILASAGRMLWRYLAANKVDADALFKRCGLDPSLIHESRSRYSYQLLCKAYVDAGTITRNENIGLEFAKYYSPLDLNALGVTFLSSGTLIEAFQRLLRYEAVVNSSLLFSIIESEGRIDLISKVPDVPEDAVRVIEDSRTAVLVDMCRLGLDKSLDPVEIAFTYPEPKSTGDHFGVFRCPVKFSQSASRISFDAADARRPFTAANRELAVSGDQILEGVINELKSSDIISQVKRTIIDTLPSGTPSQDDIAKQVFVSSRTLQRRLADENTNLRTLVLEVRRELAQKYIADKTMPLAEISYMLGFSDTSSFSRAFKQWTGDAPASFRSHIPA
jgi:AraC-like DNA-binding protein